MAKHAWRKRGSMMKTVIENNNAAGKRPLRRPRPRWEDYVTKDVRAMLG